MRSGSRVLLVLPCTRLRTNIPISMYVIQLCGVKNQMFAISDNGSLERALRSSIIEATAEFHSWKIPRFEDSTTVLDTNDYVSFSRHRTRSSNPQSLNSSHTAQKV